MSSSKETSGRDSKRNLAAEPTPTKIEILRRLGFECRLPEDRRDSIDYSVGNLVCHVVPHYHTERAEGVLVEKGDGEEEPKRVAVMVDVVLEPVTDMHDVILEDRTSDPPTIQMLNAYPTSQRHAVTLALNRLCAEFRPELAQAS